MTDIAGYRRITDTKDHFIIVGQCINVLNLINPFRMMAESPGNHLVNTELFRYRLGTCLMVWSAVINVN
jgi:hypothetical protein